MTTGPIKVLLVEPPDAEPKLVTSSHGSWVATLEVVRVDAVGEAARAIGVHRFDAILLDLTPAVAEGLDGLARLHEQTPDVPIIALIASDDTFGVEALKAGAQDSLVKAEVEGNLLIRSIRYAIERNQLRIALRSMSLVDDLTGLYNRRGFLTLARQQLKMADRMNRRVAQVFVDLDGLKWINDTYGHAEGDRALVETADILREAFRESDIVARIGGDEFVVLALEETSPAEEVFAERLRRAVTQRNTQRSARRAAALDARGRGAFPNVQLDYPLALSIGVATYDPADPCALDELMQRADHLMYAEKRTKRQSPAVGVSAPLLPEER
ncbi:MAG: diguanylate cyclase [Gemmatimonadaceae bacterium]